MTDQQYPDPAPEPIVKARLSHRIGAVVSGTVLVIVNLVTLYYTVGSWLLVPSGPGDTNFIEGAWFTAFGGTVLALLTAVLTVIPVMARWLRKRWFLVPAVLFVAATARWVLIDQMYPEPGWSAPGGLFVVEQPALDGQAPAESAE
ncbi:MAG TPA: hypothetical protein VHH34_00555 [Pseudonocardiaceae bacterium]|nr:hypothetical protein [Pseudonocardiaceae bacterium]